MAYYSESSQSFAEDCVVKNNENALAKVQQ